jgi:hypothetical protein
MLIVLPVLLLLLDFWPLRRWGRVASSVQPTLSSVPTPVPFRRLALEKLPLFVLAAVIAAVTMQSRDQHGSLVSLTDISLFARVSNAMTAYGWYLSSTFFPVRLAVLYPHPRENWSLVQSLTGAGTLLIITSVCLWQARRRPWLITGWLWFVVALLPVIGFAQGGAQAWADRFSYWPHIGLFTAVVWQVAELAGRLRIPAMASKMAGGVVLGGLAILTWNQVGYWRDSISLWEHTLAITNDNDRAHEHLSRCYYARGRPEEALAHLDEASRIQFRRLNRSHP